MSTSRTKTPTKEETPRTVILTADSVKKLQKELKDIIKVKQPALSKKLALTASFGDLPENHAWDNAQEEQAFLLGRKAEITALLTIAKIVPSGESDIVAIGSKVTVKSEHGQETFKVVDTTEANPIKKLISFDSPLGQALLGRKVGSEAILKAGNSQTSFRILKIS
ncbi:MAG: GreA/GreB family elongation factor [candidate division WWE3 bacterium]|nr:GreA/GreB family elongation factor [candidate division WWE3 bacterium]